MNPDQLFLDTLQDLREKHQSRQPYALLRGSGLLRQLLLDSQPLVDQVNSRHRLRVEFETIDFTFKPPFPIARVHLRWQNLDISTLPQARKIRVDRSRLLAAPVLVFKGREFTVHDLIQTAANVWGGVHKGSPKSDQQRQLTEMQTSLPSSPIVAVMKQALEELRIEAPMPDAIAALRGVIAVTLRGLAPPRAGCDEDAGIAI